jgi:hypothetical protein
VTGRNEREYRALEARRKVKGRNPRAGSAEKFRDREFMQKRKTTFCKIRKRKVKEKGKEQVEDERKKKRNMEDEGWG